MFSDDILYQQIGKCGKLLQASDVPTYMCMYIHQFKVFKKQSTTGYINRFDDEHCMTALADAYGVCDGSQHYLMCVGDASCAIITMANGTYYILLCNVKLIRKCNSGTIQ